MADPVLPADEARPAGPDRISTGIGGLDDILGGGLARRRVYLIEGIPGSGKTTLALQYLIAGRRAGARCLYVTLSETLEELTAVVQSHGLSLDGIDVFELSSASTLFGTDRELTLLHPWEVELGETVKLITDEFERVNPTLVVFDSLSEMRLLAQDALRYRRQILGLKQFFAGRDATVLLLDDMNGGDKRDLQLHSICHGVITLERRKVDFGPARRRLEIHKMRGSDYRAGYHDMIIRRGGLVVFPRLVAAEHHRPFAGEPVASGLAELDLLFGGGPLRGTCTLISGPAGAGKTTLAMQYVAAACARGERCAIYVLDERVGTLIARTAAQGFDVQARIEDGLLQIRQLDPAEISPGEFVAAVRAGIEQDGVRLVVIDSLGSLKIAMPQEEQLLLQLHELLSYLNQQGVVTLLLNPQAGMVGGMNSDIQVSYLADAILLLRFFESGGRVRKALAVLKNRGGPHESGIRELLIDNAGPRIGPPLSEFSGVLTGTPTYVGATEPLLAGRAPGA